MSYKFSTDAFIEEPFFNEMANMLGGIKKARGFNGKDSYQNCRCPSCGKKKAAMGTCDRQILSCLLVLLIRTSALSTD